MKKNFKDKEEKRVTTKTTKQTEPRKGGRTKFRKGSSKTYDEAKDKYNRSTDDAGSSAKNDASWYEYSSEIVAASANINFLNPIGTPYHIDKDLNVGNGTSKIDEAPSLMVLSWSMTPGMTDDYVGSPNPSITAPLNLQLRSLYTLMQSTVHRICLLRPQTSEFSFCSWIQYSASSHTCRDSTTYTDTTVC
jgi:hypothetical protein